MSVRKTALHLRMEEGLWKVFIDESIFNRNPFDFQCVDEENLKKCEDWCYERNFVQIGIDRTPWPFWKSISQVAS